MFNIVLLIFLFILFIISISNSNNNCTCDDIVENMINNNNNTFLNNGTSIITKKDIYKINEPIEITELPSCNKKIIVDYGLNIDNIINDSISISQNIIDPLLHTIEIDNKNYNLIKIEWRKTNFTINNKSIGLSLHLIHNDYKSINNLIIIIPLDLSIENKNTSTEGFKNMLYKKMIDYTNIYNPTSIIDNIKNDNKDKNNIINNITNLKDSIINNHSINSEFINKNIKKIEEEKDKFNLAIDYVNKNYDVKKINVNLLLKNDINIPKYECCGKTIGPTHNMNLCPLKTIIENNNTFYMIKEENGNENLITETSIYNKENGLLIRDYIKNDLNLIYIK